MRKDPTGLRIGFEKGLGESIVVGIVAVVFVHKFGSTVPAAILYGLYLLLETGFSSFHRHYLTGVGLRYFNAWFAVVLWLGGLDWLPLIGLTIGGLIGTASGAVLGRYARPAQAHRQ